MSTEKWVSSKEFRKITKITSQHLYLLKRDNKVEFKQLYDKTFIYKVPNELLNKQSKVAIYARVSTPKQKQDLENQIQNLKAFCMNNGLVVNYVFSDIASGMNENRKELNNLLDKIIEGEISNVIISHKDRLTRFGYGYLENMFKKFNCSITPIDLSEEKSFQNELTEDLIAIIHHFSMKFYGKRKNNLKNIEKTLKNEIKEDI